MTPKRLFDLLAALAGLIVLWPVGLTLAAAIAWDSPGGVFFRQIRIGRHGRPFRIYKFRTMAVNAGGRQLTVGDGDSRLTRVGRWLRQLKLDELPQLLNVLRGEMSLVGPRPEVRRYLRRYPGAVRATIHSLRPGITDAASIAFRQESQLLAQATDPERFYFEHILPAKHVYWRHYAARQSLWLDTRLILATAWHLLQPAAPNPERRRTNRRRSAAEAAPGQPMPHRASICFVNTLPRAYPLFLRAQAELLQRQGYAVSFVSSPGLGCAPEHFKPCRFIPLPMKRGLDPLGGPLAAWRLYRLFRRERFDLVQYSGPNAACYASLAARCAGVPVRLYAQWGLRYVGCTGLRRLALKKLEALTCACSNIVEPDSHGNLEFAIAERLYPPGKGQVVWNGSANGVDLARFDLARKHEWRTRTRIRLGIPPAAVLLGFVGSLRADKGVPELLQACQELFRTEVRLRLLLVGDKELYDSVPRHWRRWADTHPRIHCQPPSREIETLFAAMDLLVFPSHREGFGSVVIEAGAMEVPAVASAIPGPGDAIVPEKTGLLVSRGDVPALVRAMRRLLRNPEERQAMGRRSRQLVEAGFEQQELMRRFLLDKQRLLAAAGIPAP